MNLNLYLVDVFKWPVVKIIFHNTQQVPGVICTAVCHKSLVDNEAKNLKISSIFFVFKQTTNNESKKIPFINFILRYKDEFFYAFVCANTSIMQQKNSHYLH